MNPRVERLGGSLKTVNTQRRRDISRASQPRRAGQRQAEQRRRRLRAVDERQTFFGGQRRRRQTGSRQRLGAGFARSFAPGFALANQHQSQMRQRREVAAGARPTRARARPDARGD